MRRVIQVVGILTITAFAAINYADDGLVVAVDSPIEHQLPISFSPPDESVVFSVFAQLPGDSGLDPYTLIAYDPEIKDQNGAVVAKSDFESPVAGFRSTTIAATIVAPGYAVPIVDGDTSSSTAPLVYGRLHLEVTATASRTGRNPRIGEEIKIPAKTVVKFRAAIHDSDGKTMATFSETGGLPDQERGMVVAKPGSITPHFSCKDERAELMVSFDPHPSSMGFDDLLLDTNVGVQVELSGPDGEPLSGPHGETIDPVFVQFPPKRFGLIDITADYCDETDEFTALYVNGEPAGTAKVYAYRPRVNVSFKYESGGRAVKQLVAAYLNKEVWPSLSGAASIIRLAGNRTAAGDNVGVLLRGTQREEVER